MKRVVDFAYFFLSFFGLLVAGLVIGLAATPPVWLARLALGAAGTAGPWAGALLVALAGGGGYVLFGIDLLLLTVLLRNLLWLRNREGAGHFYQLAAIRTAVYNYLLNLCRHLFLPLVRGTPILVWFYRGMGARIGRGTFVLTTRLWDLDLIEIGDDCVIGGNVAINAHIISRDKGVLRAVRIGDGVTIGADSLVLPGAVIEDGVVVGTNSVVPPGARLERGGVYEGVPLQKVR